MKQTASGMFTLFALATSVAALGCQQPKQAATPGAAAATTRAPSGAASGVAGINIDHGSWGTLGYSLDWVGYPFAANHKVPMRSAEFLGSSFVIQDRESEVSLLDVTTGERRWGSTISNPLTKFVGISSDTVDASRVLVSSESEGYFLASATGALVAKADYAKVVNTKPLMLGRYAIFGTSLGEVFAHDIRNNLRGWGFATPGAIEADPVLLADGTFGIVNQAGNVYVLTSGGQLLGRNKILGPVVTDPVTDGSTIFIAGTDQSVWAFGGNGGLVWRYRTPKPLTVQPTYWNGHVLVTVPGEGLVALDSITGAAKWTAKETEGVAIAFRNGQLLVRTATGMDALNPENGERTARVALPGIVMIVPESFENSALYAVSNSGVVARFRVK
jgi:hypothetical protein